MITLIVEFLFALVFLRALVAYVRTREPLHRDVTLVFSAVAGLFALELYRRLTGHSASGELRAVVLMLLLAQPYLTLRLVARLRPLPRPLIPLALALYLATAIPVVLSPRPLPLRVLLAASAAFVVVESVAAYYLTRQARRRSGSARTRLLVAAAATVLFSVGLVAAATGSRAGAATAEAGRVLALISVAGYWVAFFPPRWLRRLWAADALYQASERLLEVADGNGARAVWQRFVKLAREMTGVEGAAVLIGPPGRPACEVAAVGLDTPRGGAPCHLDEIGDLLRPRQPIAVTPRTLDEVPGIAAAYAGRADAGLVTAVPLAGPLADRGVLVLSHRHRSLFTDDDSRLLGVLGAQAATLAERAAASEEKAKLAAELTLSVQALEAASQAKSDFLANMSHELRTPLNAIIGFSELMRGERAVGDGRVVPADWIDHVYSSGRHLLGLINDILDLAKVEAGRLELHPDALDLPGSIGDVLTTLRPLVDRKQLHVGAQLPPVAVLADPVRFRQILDNLLSNAIKFTPEGGRIEVCAEADEHTVRITVADSGIGIAAADQDRVFDEFKQVGNAARTHGGTGLGLALTRRLVQAHGGRISLRSAPGEGSAFTVELTRAPRQSPPAAEPADAATTTAASARGHILLIEDDAGAARLLREYLCGAGYEVSIASSGESGLAAAQRRRPDAIMLDVVLPGMDGWSVIRRLKGDPGLRDVPVFFTTVMDEQQVGLSLGAAEYFVKPVNRDTLLDRIARYLPQDRASGDVSILVVDEDPETLHAVANGLHAGGMRVLGCRTGEEALQLCRSQPVNLIICDLGVSDLDGFTLLAALDADPATRSIPVLALATDDLTEQDRSRLNGKILGIVPKGPDVDHSLKDWLELLGTGRAIGRVAQPAGSGGPT